jgi:hypothetical protein
MTPPAPAPKSRRTSRQPTSRAGSAAPQRWKNTQPLFLDSDEDTKMDGGGADATEDFGAVVPEEGEDEEDEAPSLLPPPRTRAAPKKAATPAMGSQKAAARTTHRAPAIVQDDDSDDGVVFKGFGKKR